MYVTIRSGQGHPAVLNRNIADQPRENGGRQECCQENHNLHSHLFIGWNILEVGGWRDGGAAVKLNKSFQLFPRESWNADFRLCGWPKSAKSSAERTRAGLPGCCSPALQGLIQLRSISTAIDRCSNSMDNTSFRADLILTTIPVTPRSGPSSILAVFPTRKYGHGIAERPLFSICLTAAISCSSTGIGILPIPAICMTPGVVSTGKRSFGFIRQNR